VVLERVIFMDINILIDAAREAGGYALLKVDDIGPVKSKSPKDFVTEVDIACEKIIIDHISKRMPEASFYGEEGGEKGSGRLLFVIDPIDATTNYIHGIPLFDISIAGYEDDVLVAGVVFCPALGEMYSAEKGKGAFCNGKRIHVSQTHQLSAAVVGWNRSNHTPEIIESSKNTIGRILDRAATIRIFGTGSLDYCYLAKGSFDACITPLAEPFHSAGYIIMEEAGAKVTDYHGNPHSLDSATIVAANPELYLQVRELLK
jgi:myo-inositol-1(or 4)-monophosphatase